MALLGTETLRVNHNGVPLEVTVEEVGKKIGRQILVPACGNAKVGATAGWLIAATDDIGHATLPAAKTASTLVIPIQGLEVGDTISGFSLVGQIENTAGNACTVDADLRKLTSGAADNTDASVGAITQVSVAVDTKLSSANAGKSGLADTVGDDEFFYLLITATTGASVDIDLMGALVTITRG